MTRFDGQYERAFWGRRKGGIQGRGARGARVLGAPHILKLSISQGRHNDAKRTFDRTAVVPKKVRNAFRILGIFKSAKHFVGVLFR